MTQPNSDLPMMSDLHLIEMSFAKLKAPIENISQKAAGTTLDDLEFISKAKQTPPPTEKQD